MSIIVTKTYTSPPFCEKEILRYAGCGAPDTDMQQLLGLCMEEAQNQLTYKVCYRELPVTITEAMCDFGIFCARSEKLAHHLAGCDAVLLFGATVGIELDRLIAKYGRISPAKALMLQAIGAERIEALCDVFCHDYAGEQGVELRARFSPGYGDLPLEVQKDVFRVLDCSRKIGLSLGGSLLMSPSKSVTAFVGVVNQK